MCCEETEMEKGFLEISSPELLPKVRTVYDNFARRLANGFPFAILVELH